LDTSRAQAIRKLLLMHKRQICRVGQNRIYKPYVAVYLVISLPKIPYIHRIYMVLANPTDMRARISYLLSLQSSVCVAFL